MAVMLAAVAFGAILLVEPVAGVSLRASMNPIRKVVTMLQSMQAKVEEEGEKEKELFEKYMCYCKSGKGDLAASITEAEEKSPGVTSEIEGSTAKLSQTKEDLKSAQDDRVAAKNAMAEATGIREKEAAAFAQEKADADANIAAITKAVTALEKGMGSSFLQTESAGQLRQLVTATESLSDDDKQLVFSFLSAGAGESYAPQSGEITGILKQMGDTMSKDLADATAAEEESVKTFEGLMAAKNKEVAALTNSIETKTTSIGELGVKIVQLKEDLSDTQAALLADKKFLKELETGCGTKAAEQEERTKIRTEETVALAETIKVLNDDSALDLFKNTLPSQEKASLLQVTSSSSAMRSNAAKLIRGAMTNFNADSKVGMDMLLLELVGKRSSGGFDKILKMIDEMVGVLKREQDDDNNKKEYCGVQFDNADDKKKDLERTVSQEQDAIRSAKDSIETLVGEIASLEAGIRSLDKSVAEATEQRKNENVEFKDLMASDTAAKELLMWAKNRLNKFYNPKLYTTTAGPALSAEDQIVVNMGGTPPPTQAPGGIAGTGISVGFVQVRAAVQRDAPAPPPETWDAYQKKSGDGNGVIAMIDLLAKDLEKEMTEAKTGEKEAQSDYEQMMKDSSDKRASDSTLLTEKTSTKADVEGELEARTQGRNAATKELGATMKYIASLHAECDWLLKYHEMRKDARTGEIESLTQAKAVLSGADYSFLQTGLRMLGF